MCARACMRAILNAMAWYLPMGCPNALRSLAYLTDSSTQPCAAPTDSAAIAMRPSSRIERKLA